MTKPTAHGESEPEEVLERSILHGRVHSAYLLTGTGSRPTDAARAFARALACPTRTGVACERCPACRKSSAEDEEIVLDGHGKRGPTFRHVGDHSDLLWVERGGEDTRITIRQIRDVQAALRLGAHEGGHRVAVIADAEWMNAQAQNALLRLLEEPPPQTSLLLVSSRASAILPTLRSRSVRLRFPLEPMAPLRGPETPESEAELVATLDGLRDLSVGRLLDLAERYRGARAPSAEAVGELIEVASRWLVEDIKERVALGGLPDVRELDAHRSIQQLRRDLVGRNANPQMVAERLLLGLREVASSAHVAR